MRSALLTGMLVLFLIVLPIPTAKAQNQVMPGMTLQQVIKIWGNPDGYSKDGNVQLLTYKHRLIGPWWQSTDLARADYHVVLTDGLVTSYGYGEVRQPRTGGGAFVIIPMR